VRFRVRYDIVDTDISIRFIHNVHIECLWVDVQKDYLESFRQVFIHLENQGLLDMSNQAHQLCLLLVYQPRIQAMLDRAKNAWNHHQIRTAHYRTPITIFELSQEKAVRKGYWTGDPGDDVDNVDEAYGIDGDAPIPLAENSSSGVTNSKEEIATVKRLFGDFQYDRQDDNWGISVYCEAVLRLASIWGESQNKSNETKCLSNLLKPRTLRATKYRW
jgi:hypothetical protein